VVSRSQVGFGRVSLICVEMQRQSRRFMAHLRKLMQRSLPGLAVLSYAELDPDAPVEKGRVVNL